MSSLLNIHLPKPKDWQDFERKSRELFACVLGDPHTQLNGRSGQPQHGIDIFGYRDGDRTQLVGVQCKNSDDEITVDELEAEFGKALGFEPPLSEFILITTAPRDERIQKKAREITKRLSTSERPILVAVWGWQQIEEHASKYAQAHRAFDPTFNPYAERTHQETVARLANIEGNLRSNALSRWTPQFIVPQLETPSFTGRDEELARLDQALWDTQGNHVCSIVGLSGTGGIGKSALAVHFAAHHRARFPDGVIGIRVDGKANETIARQFAQSVGEVFAPEDERDPQSIMQSVFGARNVLLIFDNAEDARVRHLIPGGQSKVIITTRDRGLPALLEVPVAGRIDLSFLPKERAMELLRKRLGTRVDIELEAAARIVSLVGGLPLALQIVASLLEIEPWRSLASIEESLANERKRLSELTVRDDGNLDVRISFMVSLRRLTADEIDFFACLSICDLDSFAVRTAAASARCSPEIANRRLANLYRLSLVNRPSGPGETRFLLHPLLRSFAAELCHERDLSNDAGERHARYFIDLVKGMGDGDATTSHDIHSDIGDALIAARWLLRARDVDEQYLASLQPIMSSCGRWREAGALMADRRSLAEERGETEIAVRSRIQEAKFLQLRGELQQAFALLEPVVSGSLGPGAFTNRAEARLLNTYGVILQRLGRLSEAEDALTKAWEIEKRMEDESGEAVVLNTLGVVLQRMNKFQEAATAFERARILSEKKGDDRSLAMALHSLGGVYQRLGRLNEAENALKQSLAISENRGDHRSLGMVLNSLGGVLQRLDKLEQAKDALERSKDLAEEIGDDHGLALTLNSLGGVLQRLGNLDQAAVVLARSYDLVCKQGDSRGEAMVLTSLAGVLRRQGKLRESADALERAKALSEKTNDPRTLAMVLHTYGRVLQISRRFEEAQAALAQSYNLLVEHHDERGQAMVLNSLASVLKRSGHFTAANEALGRAIVICEKIDDDRGLAMALSSLGEVLQHLGRLSEADKAFASSIEISKKLANASHLAKVRTIFGKALVSRGELEQGIDQLRGAFLLEEASQNKYGLPMVTQQLATALRSAGKNLEAQQFIDRALLVSPNIREGAVSDSRAGRTPTCIRGRITRLIEQGGREAFGFLITEDGGKDVYFSERRIGRVTFATLSKGAVVEATVLEEPNGQRHATSVRVVNTDEHGEPSTSNAPTLMP